QDVSVNAGETVTLPPGNYKNLTLANRSILLGRIATLILRPGIYTFSGSFTTGSDSVVRLEGQGGSAVYVSGNITIGNAAAVNTDNSTRTLFFFSRGNVSLADSSGVRSFIYTRGTVLLEGRAELRGAITA